MIKSVLIVLKQLNFGGSERYAINLANALINNNISVILVAGQGPYASHISPKIKLFFAPISRSRQNKQIAEKIIFDIAKKYKPQLIHAQCRNSLLCCQLARRVFQIPVISHEHLAYKASEYAFVVNELNSNCDIVITIAPYLAKRLIRNGLKKTRVKIVLNGINLNNFTSITNEERIETRNSLNLTSYNRVILCLSRIVPGKGIEKLVDAFKIVCKRIPSARLIIAGDDEWGDTKAKIEEKIMKSNLSGKVLIYPAHFDIRKFHSAADVFCYPPINRGMAVMEAMASELPIVAKRSLTKPFVVEHNIHGLLLQTDKVGELADQLTILLRKKALARQMGRAARQRIKEKFNLDDVIRITLKIYQQAIKANESLHTEKPVCFSTVTRNYLLSTQET
ncbi:MAG: glycosyltransferase family 4 protein [Candidatus Daviesbacteria bacterium]|nr:glycosyltransferase family 4 protein [Candidatus Daviesbacteria bacterium]